MTYKIKEKVYLRFKGNKKIADEIGITREALSRILNGKQKTKKAVAYLIVKLYDSEAEIDDYFERCE